MTTSVHTCHMTEMFMDLGQNVLQLIRDLIGWCRILKVRVQMLHSFDQVL